MSRPRTVLAPGYVRRLSPTVCVVEQFAGSSDDDRAQLDWLARVYARRMPFGRDWSLERWSQEIAYVDGDHACRAWLLNYVRRLGGHAGRVDLRVSGHGSADGPRVAMSWTLH